MMYVFELFHEFGDKLILLVDVQLPIVIPCANLYIIATHPLKTLLASHYNTNSSILLGYEDNDNYAPWSSAFAPTADSEIPPSKETLHFPALPKGPTTLPSS
jgi:hypothetical protein